MFNPFPPSVPIWHRLAKHSILILEGIIKKKFLGASWLWVGRRKVPILGYVPKNYERKNSGSNGLKAASLPVTVENFKTSYFNLLLLKLIIMSATLQKSLKNFLPRELIIIFIFCETLKLGWVCQCVGEMYCNGNTICIYWHLTFGSK